MLIFRCLRAVKKTLSIQDKLLLAAVTLDDEGRTRFSAEDLVVMAWSKYPEAFGLAGYPDKNGIPLYPNSNRVYVEIMGSKPLRKNGLLRKVGSKMYQLTEAGRIQAESLSQSLYSDIAEKWSLAREQVEFIRRLFESRAAIKFRAKQLEEISFFDACGFWGLSAGSNAKDLWSRFASIESLLSKAEESLLNRDAVSIKHGSTQFMAADLKLLRDTHAFLQDRFITEIEHIKGRTDER